MASLSQVSELEGKDLGKTRVKVHLQGSGKAHVISEYREEPPVLMSW